MKARKIMNKDLTTIYRQYPAMFQWFTNAYDKNEATLEFGAAYIYECLNGVEDNVFWAIIEQFADEDGKLYPSKQLFLDAANAIIETTRLNTKGKTYG
jgi:hypothetical protein